MQTTASVQIEKLVLARLRGFCAGVVRAIDIVEKALQVCGGTVYVRKEIVHNRYVVEELRKKGAVFVEDLDQVPENSWLIFSAHGISPEVRRQAKEKNLKVIDATCPLVTKVHLEAIQYARNGYTILLIGHKDHDETIGTLGEAPGRMRIIETAEEAEKIEVEDPEKTAFLTQTTLSLDDTKEIISVLKRRFPKLKGPGKDDICYATQNRQNAVKAMTPSIDALLVLGAHNSSNSIRLQEVGQASGIPSYLIESVRDIKPEWLSGVKVLGLTASASAPEYLVQETVDYCRKEFNVREVEEFETVEENVVFALPPELIHQQQKAQDNGSNIPFTV